MAEMQAAVHLVVAEWAAVALVGAAPVAEG